MKKMSTDEWQHLLLDRPRPAIVTVVDTRGRAHATPVWIDMDGDRIVFTTEASSVKGRVLRRDPRVTLCVDDDAPPFSFVTISGRASISTDRDELHYWAVRLGGRYMGPETADRFAQRNGGPGELLVRVSIDHVTAMARVAD